MTTRTGIAIARYVRVSPRKVEQLLRVIRRETVKAALEMLSMTVKAASLPLSKTIKSALANMGKNIDPAKVVIEEAVVGKGVYLKRFRAGPQGRGMPYTRKTCHIKVKLKAL